MPERVWNCRHVLLIIRVKDLVQSMKSQKYYSKLLGEIGGRLAQLREQNGYDTLKEFVQKHDLPEVQYWRMEKGKANITLKSLVRILSIHRVSLQDFFCRITAEEKV